ncbi:phosphoribosylanthranilate isomerase [Oceanobacillus sp. CAU 1775]
MLVKICGIQTFEAAEVAVLEGADFIGFVFAKSKRRITPEAATKISRATPNTVKKVGVFVNETVENMIAIAEQVGLDVIQLHGDESHETATSLPYEIIKAFPAQKERVLEMQSYPCDFYLIDTPSKKQRGGTGKTYDWTIFEELNLNHNKLILAGGLTPENVALAIEEVRPLAVDVSSGVEINGEKSLSKIQQFLKNAKQGEDGENDNLHNAR